jgi:hypothetical protein
MDSYFENGYYIDRYYALEEDLLKFFNYITLEFYPKPQNRRYIRSIYLSDLLVRIESNISTFFDRFIDNYLYSGGTLQHSLWLSYSDHKMILRELEATKEKSDLYWRDYKKLEPILNLANHYVILIPLDEKLYPFRDTRKGERSWVDIKADEPVFWWNSYNLVKHNAKFNDANLNIVLHALAALLLLITRPEFAYSSKFERYDYVKKEAIFELGVNAFGEDEIVKNGYIHEISTRLFKLGSPIK